MSAWVVVLAVWLLFIATLLVIERYFLLLRRHAEQEHDRWLVRQKELEAQAIRQQDRVRRANHDLIDRRLAADKELIDYEDARTGDEWKRGA